METTLTQKIERIKELCLTMEGTNPVEIAKNLMKDPLIAIHGPEHHILDGAAFLTAMHNAGAAFDLAAALDEMEKRGRQMPGATCGLWGVCGSAASVGAALAILHQTGPLSDNEYYKDNLRLTSRALTKMAEIGGPRCCKRNAFLSLQTAAELVKETYGIELEMNEIHCEFSARNQQCIGSRCPFSQHPAAETGKDSVCQAANRELPKVAFICVHNSCRSQMAEALGKALAADVFESYSAGTETKPQINQDAVRIMKDLYGIDMELTQRSKLLSDIPAVDVVITMGCNVSCPNLPSRHREDWGLDDPSGKADEAFIWTAKEIEKKIKDLRERVAAGKLF